MPSIAFIGPDGAGKTTLTHMLLKSNEYRFKYLYMGINAESSNILLPTSRWAERIKARLGRRPARGNPQAAGRPHHRTGKSGPARWLWSAGRLMNRLAEEWYRQIISWCYQWSGYVVLYDRHYLLDFVNDAVIGKGEPLNKRLHRWTLLHLYPRPDLVIYLDAPAKVLYRRKGELTIPELERRRIGFILLGKQFPNFVQINATRPLDLVYSDVLDHVHKFVASRKWAAAPVGRTAPEA